MRTQSIPLAIDPKLDCYAILGVAATADQAAIRAAFAAGFQYYHPNHFPGTRSEARRKLADLSAAYELLSDPVRRRRYDLHRRIHAATETIDARRSGVQRDGADLPTNLATDLANNSAAEELARVRRPDRYRVPFYVLMSVVLLAAGYAALHADRLLAALAPAGASADLPATAEHRAPAPAPAPPVAAVQTPQARHPEARPGRAAPTRQPAAPAAGECNDVRIALGFCAAGSTSNER